MQLKPVPLLCWGNYQGEKKKYSRCLSSLKFPDDRLREIFQLPPISFVKHLLLETPLWDFTRSVNNKSLPKGLKDLEGKKGR